MIQLFKPCYGEEEIEALRPVMMSGWTGLGPKTEEFEKRFAEFIGVEHCVGLSSCTAALDLAMRLLHIGPGDEVIVPTMTFVSTAHAVAYNGARPVFCDVDEQTLCIDPRDVAKRITSKTKAIVAVHMAGRPANLEALNAIALSIPLIEDCAHGTGSYLGSNHVGSIGDIGCFSFHAVKNLSTGDGGMLATNDDDMAERCRRLRWLGIDKGTWDRSKVGERYWWEYAVDEIGLKCHMNDIQAAIGLVQLGKLEVMNKRRREIDAMYRSGLRNIASVKLPKSDYSDSRSSWHIFHIRCAKRNALAEHLRSQGIATGVHYKPIHLYKCYGLQPELPVAEEAFKSILSLPMHPGLSDADVTTVCDAIKEFYV